MIVTNSTFQRLHSYVPEVFLSTKERINAIASNALDAIGINTKNIVHYGSRVFLVYIFHLTMMSILDFLVLNTAPLIATAACVVYCAAFFAFFRTVTSLYIPCFTYNDLFLEKYKTNLSTWLIKLNHFLGFDINTPDEHGNTVLHYCASGFPIHKYTDAILSLEGIDPNNANMLGFTPLILAARWHNYNLTRSLLKVKNIKVDLIGNITNDLALRINRPPETAFKEFMDNNMIFLGSHADKQITSMFISQGADYDFIKEPQIPTWVMPLINNTMEPIRIQAKKTQDAIQKILLTLRFPMVISTLIVGYVTALSDKEIQRETRENNKL